MNEHSNLYKKNIFESEEMSEDHISNFELIQKKRKYSTEKSNLSISQMQKQPTTAGV